MQRRTPLLAAALGIPVSMALLIPGGAVALPDQQQDPGPSTSAFFQTEPSAAAPEQIAVDFLRLKAGGYGVAAADLADLQVLSQHTSDRNGVTYVNVVQHYQGREVLDGVATVSVTEDGVVLHVAENLVGGLREASGRASLDAPAALDAAAEEVDLAPQSARVLSQSRDASRETTLSAAGITEEEIPARLVWQPTEDGCGWPGRS